MKGFKPSLGEEVTQAVSLLNHVVKELHPLVVEDHAHVLKVVIPTGLGQFETQMASGQVDTSRVDRGSRSQPVHLTLSLVARVLLKNGLLRRRVNYLRALFSAGQDGLQSLTQVMIRRVCHH